ncbi:MAG: hypothetical protein K6B46_02435 [Opitutales bacterium]|nr:hypothetical protein [Opitutales bacterium]
MEAEQHLENQEKQTAEKNLPSSPAAVPAAKSQRRSRGKWALFALRLFIAARMIGIGLSKFVAQETVYDENGVPATVRRYAFENYQGVPADFLEKLATDPLFPQWLLEYFSLLLGPMLVGMGACVLLGAKLKWSLLILALLLAAMTFGLALVSPDAPAPVFDLLAIAAAFYLTEKTEK